jgi:hypothetical protein
VAPRAVSEPPPSDPILYFPEPMWSRLTSRWPLGSRILFVVPAFIVVSEVAIRIGLLVRPQAKALADLQSSFTFVLALIAMVAMWMLKGRWFPYHLTDGIVIGKTGPRWHYRPPPWYWRPFANTLREKSRFALWEQYEGFEIRSAAGGSGEASGLPALLLGKAEEYRRAVEAPFAMLCSDRSRIRLPYDASRTDADSLATALRDRLSGRGE